VKLKNNTKISKAIKIIYSLLTFDTVWIKDLPLLVAPSRAAMVVPPQY
jgi:hypothetical protein